MRLARPGKRFVTRCAALAVMCPTFERRAGTAALMGSADQVLIRNPWIPANMENAENLRPRRPQSSSRPPGRGRRSAFLAHDAFAS